jgi:hypothetical protein
MTIRSMMFVTAALLASGVPAQAQTAPARGWVDVNLISAYSAQDAQTYVLTRTVALEPAAFATAYPKMPSVTGFDIHAGIRLNGPLAFGIYTMGVTSDYRVGLGATVPHPLLFNDSTTAGSTTASSLARKDRSLDFSLSYLLPAGRNVAIRVFGGPTYFSVTQGMVSDIHYTQTYNLLGTNIVDITTFNQQSVSGSAWGVHGGVDAAYFFSRYVGIGAGFRVNRGRAAIEDPLSGTSAKLKVGHAVVGGGLRLRF